MELFFNYLKLGIYNSEEHLVSWLQIYFFSGVLFRNSAKIWNNVKKIQKKHEQKDKIRSTVKASSN